MHAVLALAPREARRLVLLASSLARVLVLGALAPLAGCGPPNPQASATQLDRAYETAVFTWLLEHDPSRLNLYGVRATPVAPLLPGTRLREATGDLRSACRVAKADHALLLVVARKAATRTLALDCGFALERDAGALVLAPR